jgi:cytochrome b561
MPNRQAQHNSAASRYHMDMLRNDADSWGAPAKLFHWVMAALILAQITLGWMAASWRLSPMKLELFFWHKSNGMLILLLVALRLLWRLANPSPALPSGMAAWERAAARMSHVLLYVLMIAMPVTGWIVNSASNIPFRIFWLIPLPAIVAPDKPTADLVALVHGGLFAALALVLVAHIGAALRHHFVKRNTVLTRMLPGTWRTT